MEVNLIRNGNKAQMLLSGRIDANTTQALGKILLDAAEKYDEIALDFEKVPYISSAGLRALKIAHRAMQEKNGRFTLKNVRKDVMDVFRVTGFSRFLDFEES